MNFAAIPFVVSALLCIATSAAGQDAGSNKRSNTEIRSNPDIRKDAVSKKAAGAYSEIQSAPSETGATVTALAFNGDASMLARGQSDGTLVAHNIGKDERAWRVRLEGVTDMLSIPEADALAVFSGTSERSGDIKLFDWQTGEQLGRVGPYAGGRNGFSLHRSTGTLAFISAGNQIDFVDLKSSKLLAPIQTDHDESICSIAFNHDATKLYVGSESGVITAISMGQTPRESVTLFDASSRIMDLKVQPGVGTVIAAGCKNGSIHLYNDDDKAEKPHITRLSYSSISKFHFSPLHPDVLIVGTQALSFVDCTTGERLVDDMLLSDNPGSVWGFAISDDGSHMATGHRRGQTCEFRNSGFQVFASEIVKGFKD
ncbi:MAG: WD40 repeat domain-containing protein [Planctomycetaceae bacterium]|nr:WD40 repeat domain-containing protein [Planctomycetaceae bacterium]